MYKFTYLKNSLKFGEVNMKKRIVSLLFAFMLLVCAATLCTYAEDFLPDESGKYTVELEAQPNNEYLLIVLQGIYDETNYIEAYNNSQDSDIMYFEQKGSDENGIVSFGPFVPSAYIDSTVILGGTNYSQPILAGYLRSNGVTNIASLEISGVAESYTVNGGFDADTVVDVDVIFYDSYGYAAITDKKAVLSVEQSDCGVTVDNTEGTLIIDNMAPEGTVTVVATLDDISDSFDVTIVREQPVIFEMALYITSDMTHSVKEAELVGIDGTYPTLKLYAKSLDQYGDKIVDSYLYTIDDIDILSSNEFTPTQAGEYVITAYSSNSLVWSEITVTVIDRPDYTGNALALYELIAECKTERKLIDTEKYLSSENGKDIYAPDVWTTEEKLIAFDSAIATAELALTQFNSSIIDDAALEDSITALTSAKNSYLNSFKTGIRVDAQTIAIEEQDVVLSLTDGETTTLTAVMTPALNTEKLTWVSSDSNIIAVDSKGKITPKSNGEATITVTTRNGLSATTVVTSHTPITKLEISDTNLEMAYGDEPYRLSVTAYPSTHTDVITWTSSRPGVATVDSSGLVTPVWEGKTVITVTSGSGKSIECTVYVTLPQWGTAATPVSDVQSGTIISGTYVTLSTETLDSTIYYTLDGTEPDENSRIYTSPLKITTSCTLKAIAIADNMFVSEVAQYEYTVVNTAISAKDTLAVAGSEVTVPVSLANNPGISELALKIEYADGVSLVSVEKSQALASLGFETDPEQTNAASVRFYGEDTSDSTEGELLLLNFNVPQGTASGSYEVKITVESALDKNGNKVEISDIAFKLKVSDVIIGDVNGDGDITIADVVLLAQYVAKWESAKEKTIVEASDVNADGDVTIADVVRLAQYVAKWDVELG